MSRERRTLVRLLGKIDDRKWKSMKDLVASGLFPTTEAARKFCTKYEADLILGRKGGRELLVDEHSLNRFLENRARSA